VSNHLSDSGVPVTLRGITLVFYPLTFAAMKRTRAQRDLVFKSRTEKVAMSPEWEQAVVDILYESLGNAGKLLRAEVANDDGTTTEVKGREAFETLLTPGNIGECFNAMTRASALEAGVAEDGSERPTKSLNGTGSTHTSSPVLDGPGSSATN